MKKAVDQLTEKHGKRHSFIVGLMLLLGLMSSTGGYGQWVQLGMDIDGEAVGDQSGYSVSLSADGSRLASGAPFNDGTGSGAGHVRVYEGFIRSSGAAATPLPFMPGGQLLLWGLVLVSLSGLVISRLGGKSI